MSEICKATFLAFTKGFKVLKHSYLPIGRQLTRVAVDLCYEIKVEIQKGTMPIIDLKYGYKYGFGNLCHEGADSCNPGQAYRIFSQVEPKENDIWKHPGTGRSFKVTDVTGFLVYTAKLVDLATGKQVAEVRWEDYYKD